MPPGVASPSLLSMNGVRVVRGAATACLVIIAGVVAFGCGEDPRPVTCCALDKMLAGCGSDSDYSTLSAIADKDDSDACQYVLEQYSFGCSDFSGSIEDAMASCEGPDE